MTVHTIQRSRLRVHAALFAGTLAALAPGRARAEAFGSEWSRLNSIYARLREALPDRAVLSGVGVREAPSDLTPSWVDTDGPTVCVDPARMALVPDDEGRAFVLAHEIGHVLLMRGAARVGDFYEREALADLTALVLLRRAGYASFDVNPIADHLATLVVTRDAAPRGLRQALARSLRRERESEVRRWIPNLDRWIADATPLGTLLAHGLEQPWSDRPSPVR